MSELIYTLNPTVSADDFIDLLQRSTLAARRPVHDRVCIQGMLDHTTLMVTASRVGRLVGIARSVTDLHYCCYLSDLAVDVDFQRQGIGKRLIELTREQLGPRCSLILLSAPAAVAYYPHIGFEHHNQAWILRPINPDQGSVENAPAGTA